jgi:hypothetical protein
MAIQAVGEQFVFAMKLHILQLTALFYQQAEAEGISPEDRDETLQDVEADLREMMTLDQRLKIDSVGDLFKLGTIATGIMNFGHFKIAEETKGSLYSLPNLYQSWLEEALSYEWRQLEGYECKVKAIGLENHNCLDLAYLHRIAAEEDYQEQVGVVSFDASRLVEKRLKVLSAARCIRAYGNEALNRLQYSPFE